MACRERSGFIGKERDNETGLGDFGVRKYDFLAGRFTSPDAMWEKYVGLTPYQYAGNNPMLITDPSGFGWFQDRLDDAKDAVRGAVDAVLTDVSGINKPNTGRGGTIYDAGQFAGHGTAMVVGAYVAAEGLLNTAVGVIGSPTGAGIGLAAEGVVQTAIAGKVSNNAATNFIDMASKINEGGGSETTGTQFNSKTLYNKEGVRVDVENPNPKQRPGQIHMQIGDEKFIYDSESAQFKGLSTTLQKKYSNDKNIQTAIEKGKKMLGGNK